METAAMETVNEFLKTLARSGVKLSAEAGQLNCYAPNGALTAELRTGIVRHKPEILALLDGREKTAQANVARIAPETLQEFPLSAGQKGLYILQQINPGMTAYNLPLCVRINGRIDVDLLEKAWSLTLEQYPILAARIVENGSDGTLSHQVDPRCRTTIERQSIAVADEQQLIAFLRQRVKRPYDLARGPLSRIELFTLNDQERVLLVTIHHMIFDGVSAVLLLRSLFTNCQALSEGKTVSDAGQGYAGNVAAGDCACEASPVSRADGLVSRRAPRVLSSLRAAGALCATGLPCGNPAVRRQERLTASRSRRGETPVHFRPP